MDIELSKNDYQTPQLSVMSLSFEAVIALSGGPLETPSKNQENWDW